MSDILVAIGLVLVLEGLLWASAPHLAIRLLATAAQMPEQKLRTAGAAAVAVGVVIVWLVRGWTTRDVMIRVPMRPGAST